jgi:acetyl esterase/lipase
VVGFNINYRLAPAHAWPAAAQDVGAAVQWIREHAPGYGVDPQRVVLLGHSAGAAHVAACAADRQCSAQAIAGAALVSGIYDFGAMTLTPGRVAYFGSDAAQLAARSTLAGLADSGLPLFVSVAEDDPPEIAAQAVALLQRAQQARGSLPAFVRATGQNHFSTILHLGAFDTPFSLELIDFVRGSRIEQVDGR